MLNGLPFLISFPVGSPWILGGECPRQGRFATVSHTFLSSPVKDRLLCDKPVAPAVAHGFSFHRYVSGSIGKPVWRGHIFRIQQAMIWCRVFMRSSLRPSRWLPLSSVIAGCAVSSSGSHISNHARASLSSEAHLTEVKKQADAHTQLERWVSPSRMAICCDHKTTAGRPAV